MEVPPEPWEELLNIFQLSTTPAQTGSRWLDQMLHSSRFKAPNFDQFLVFLVTPVPKIDSDMKLVVEPKFAEYAAGIRSSILEFLQVNLSLITDKCIANVVRHVEQFYCSCSESSQLLNVLRSKLSTGQVRTLPSSTRMTAEKRPINDCTDKQPVTKKMRIDSATSEIEFKKQELRFLVDNKDLNKVICFLKSCEESWLESACDVLSFSSLELNEDFIVKIGHCIAREKGEHPFVATSFLNSLWRVFLKKMVKTASRQLLQMITSFSKENPLASMKFFESFLSNVELNTNQSTLILKVSKLAFTPQQQLALLRSVLQNEQLLASNFTVAVATFLGFLNLPISLDEQDVHHLGRFFKNHSKSASTCFNFTKLLLIFLKKNANCFSSENLALMQEVVSHNETSLKSACKALLSKVKPK